MTYLLSVKEKNSFKEHIFIHKKYNQSRELYSFTNYNSLMELISSFNEVIFIQGNIFIQGKHIHSGKLYPFKEIYSFKEHIFVHVEGHMFIQENYIHSTPLRSRA